MKTELPTAGRPVGRPAPPSGIRWSQRRRPFSRLDRLGRWSVRLVMGCGVFVSLLAVVAFARSLMENLEALTSSVVVLGLLLMLGLLGMLKAS